MACGCTSFEQGLSKYSKDKVACVKREADDKILCVPAAFKETAKFYKRKKTLITEVFADAKCATSDYELCYMEIPPPFPPTSPPPSPVSPTPPIQPFKAGKLLADGSIFGKTPAAPHRPDPPPLPPAPPGHQKIACTNQKSEKKCAKKAWRDKCHKDKILQKCALACNAACYRSG